MSFWLMAVFSSALIPKGLGLRCYGCRGFEPGLPYHPTTNNLACSLTFFHPSLVTQYVDHSPTAACYTLTYIIGGRLVTVRYLTNTNNHHYYARAALGKEERILALWGNAFTLRSHGTTNRIWVTGYYCYTDLCNGANHYTSIIPFAIVLSLMISLFGQVLI